VSTGEFLVRAVACIKVAGSEVAGQPIRVDDEQSPVIDLLDNGLMVVYLVDEGDRLVYVQHKHANAIKADPRGLLDFGLANLGRLAEAKLKLFRHGAIHGMQLDGQGQTLTPQIRINSRSCGTSPRPNPSASYKASRCRASCSKSGASTAAASRRSG
jgi:hypothetical protein